VPFAINDDCCGSALPPQCCTACWLTTSSPKPPAQAQALLVCFVDDLSCPMMVNAFQDSWECGLGDVKNNASARPEDLTSSPHGGLTSAAEVNIVPMLVLSFHRITNPEQTRILFRPAKEDKLTIDCETPKATFRATWLLALPSSISQNVSSRVRIGPSA
jgi:hypothetical protein